MHRHFGQRPAFPGKHLVRRYLVGLQPYSRGASAGSHRSAPLETSQVPTPRVVSQPRRLRLTPGNANRVSSRMSHFPKGPPMIVGCKPQFPQNEHPHLCQVIVRWVSQPCGYAPSELVSGRGTGLTRLERLPNSAGISPVNSLLESDSTTRLVRPPNSAGISPVNWLLESDSPTRLVRPPNTKGLGSKLIRNPIFRFSFAF